MDAPNRADVTTIGACPPVPIVVDGTSLHKHTIGTIGTMPGGEHRKCYDEMVWKRVTARHAGQFVKHVVPAVIKPARVLWNEVIGFLFLCMGVIFGSKSVSLYLDYAKAPSVENAGRLVLMVAGTLLMLYFGITSFLRARKISRS